MFDVEAVVRSLAKHKVRHVIIGGVAMRFHASAILTQDIDIAYAHDPANIERMVSALKGFHPRLRGVGEPVPFRFDARTIAAGLNFTLETDVGDIDLLGAVPGFKNYLDLEKHSEGRRLGTITVPVLSLEGLIIAKRASGRPKDLIALPELEALLENKRPHDD